jgi:hypothetical protein
LMQQRPHVLPYGFWGGGQPPGAYSDGTPRTI